MPTEREYLVSIGLAKPGRGRFSQEAKYALKKAREDGVDFATPARPAAKNKPADKPIAKPADKPVAESKPATNERPRYDSAAVREWAKNEGLEVSARGRISSAILEQYANSDSPVVAVERSVDGAIQEAPQRRFAEKWYGTHNNITIVKTVRDVCNRCLYSIGWCTCAQPSHLTSDDVYVPLTDTKPVV